MNRTEQPLKLSLICDKCGDPITIIAIKDKLRLSSRPENVVIIGKCPRNHKKKFLTSSESLTEWLPIVESHFYKCIYCDQPITFTVKQTDPYVYFKMRCPVHGKTKRYTSLQAYERLSSGTEIHKAEKIKKALMSSNTADTLIGFIVILLLIVVGVVVGIIFNVFHWFEENPVEIPGFEPVIFILVFVLLAAIILISLRFKFRDVPSVLNPI